MHMAGIVKFSKNLGFTSFEMTSDFGLIFGIQLWALGRDGI
jgi:hypothetical protein